MSRRPKRLAGAAVTLVIALAGALAPPLGAADRATPGQKQYLAAVTAYDSADYETAARLFRVAIAEDPSEGLAKFSATGLNKEDYLPHFYLGLSLEKLGQGPAALVELKESAKQGAIRGRASSARILDNAIGRLDVVKVAAAVPTAVPTHAAAPTSVPAERPTAAPRPTERPAIFIAPTSPPKPTAVRKEEPPAQTPVTVLAESRPTPAPAATRAPRRGAEPAPSSESVAAAREGIRNYFKGDYSTAARLLEPLAASVPSARLFLAYSLAGAQLLAPTRDETVVTRARQEYQTARHELKTVDERLISPAVRGLLESR